MPVKNDLLEVIIEDLSNEGEGIGHADGYTLFVKDAVIGDRVLARITKAKKSYAYARTEKILCPSPDRAVPLCPRARSCGGCRLQELTYPKQLSFKENIVRSNLSRIGGFLFGDGSEMQKSPATGESTGPAAASETVFEPILAAENPFRYRNKAQYPVGTDRKTGRIITGFYAGRTHDIIDIRDCALTRQHNADILETIISFMEKYRIPAYDETTGTGLVRHILIREGFATGEILVCLVINGKSVPHSRELAERLSRFPQIRSVCLNINEKRTNVILGNEVLPLAGHPWIEDRLGDVTFRISPLSFYQVNPAQALRLYRSVLAYADLHGTEIVFDLFCGIGTISLFLARKAKAVYGVEIVEDAVRDARENAMRAGITNARFFAAAAEEIAQRGFFDENTPLMKPDVIVLDPPRKGCEESLLKVILKLGPEKIVYVSCDSATLARDLKILCTAPPAENGAGYRYYLSRVQPADLFPQTTHVETVVLMSRRNA